MTTTATIELAETAIIPIATAAKITGYTVATFYSENFLRNHPTLPRKSVGKTWGVTLLDLREAGLLTNDYKTLRPKASLTVIPVSPIGRTELETGLSDSLEQRNRDLEHQVEILSAKLAFAEHMLAEKNKINATYQSIIEMLQNK